MADGIWTMEPIDPMPSALSAQPWTASESVRHPEHDGPRRQDLRGRQELRQRGALTRRRIRERRSRRLVADAPHCGGVQQVVEIEAGFELATVHSDQFTQTQV